VATPSNAEELIRLLFFTDIPSAPGQDAEEEGRALAEMRAASSLSEAIRIAIDLYGAEPVIGALIGSATTLAEAEAVEEKIVAAGVPETSLPDIRVTRPELFHQNLEDSSLEAAPDLGIPGGTPENEKLAPIYQRVLAQLSASGIEPTRELLDRMVRDEIQAFEDQGINTEQEFDLVPGGDFVASPFVPLDNRNLIGIDTDYRAPPDPFTGIQPSDPYFANVNAPGYNPNINAYEIGDNNLIFVGRGFEEKQALQLELEAAGILPKGSYSPGTWDKPTAAAMAVVMDIANNNGKTWSFMLGQMVANPPANVATQGRVFPGLVYREPSFETLAQAAKTQWRRELGREPEEWEIALAADELTKSTREAFELDLDTARRQFYGSGGDLGTVEQVDPTAAFRERFEELYGPEIGRLDRIEEGKQNFSLLLNNFGKIGQQVQ